MAGANVKNSILFEVFLLWLVTNLLIRGVIFLHEGLGVHEAVLVLVPLAFMYGPVWVCNLRKVDAEKYPISLPSFRDGKTWKRAFKSNLVVMGIITGPFFVGYHLWHTKVLGNAWTGTWPEDLWLIIGYHLFFVAIPEEFFYRGYLQSRLDELWSPRWRVFGAKVGIGLFVTCLIFAFGHSIVRFQTWHIWIFFPSLVFGWMRASTGDVMAGAFFHAWCNITVTILDSLYGVSVQ